MSEQQILQSKAPQVKTSAPVIPLKTVDQLEVPKFKMQVKPSWFKKNALIISAILCVLVPGLFGSFYFMVLASDRYAAGAGFSVRSMDGGASGGDILGLVSGLATSGSTTSDSFIIQRFLTSRILVEKLIEDADFIEAYSSDKIDFLYRLDPSKPIEEVVKYWEWMIDAHYDNSSDLIEFEVQAFTPEDAEKIASLITKYAHDLINQLSEKAREDAVRFAKKEVSSAELRLKLIREELRRFRAETNAVDPAANAAALIELTTQIEGQIIELRARLATLRQSLSDSSPSVIEIKKQIEALSNELVGKRREISTASSDKNLANLLAGYERLQVEQEFAQQAYTVTLASLERAKGEADRQQRFLAVFSNPAMPDSAIYPYRILSSFTVFLVALLVWGIGLLLFFSVRDHLR